MFFYRRRTAFSLTGEPPPDSLRKLPVGARVVKGVVLRNLKRRLPVQTATRHLAATMCNTNDRTAAIGLPMQQNIQDIAICNESRIAHFNANCSHCGEAEYAPVALTGTATGDGRRATSDGQRATGDGRRRACVGWEGDEKNG